MLICPACGEPRPAVLRTAPRGAWIDFPCERCGEVVEYHARMAPAPVLRAVADAYPQVREDLERRAACMSAFMDRFGGRRSRDGVQVRQREGPR